MVFLENSMDISTQTKPASGQGSTDCADDYVESVWGEDPSSLLSGACEDLRIWVHLYNLVIQRGKLNSFLTLLLEFRYSLWEDEEPVNLRGQRY